MSYRLYEGGGAIEVVERDDNSPSSRLYNDAWIYLKRHFSDEMLAILILRISQLSIGPIDASHAFEVVGGKYETHILPIRCGPHRMYVSFVYELEQSRIVLLGLQIDDGVGQLTLREKLFRDVVQYYGLINPVREFIGR